MPINNRAPIAIDTNRFGEDPGCLRLPLATNLNTKRIKFTFKIALMVVKYMNYIEALDN